MTRLAALLCSLAWLAAASASTAAADGDTTAALTRSQSAIGHRLPDATFTDTAGRTVRLDQFRGKPLIVSMIYTGCADVCPALIEHLYPAIELGQGTLGRDGFNTVTIGFDTLNDTPDRMRAFARSHGADLPGWSFLAGDRANVDALANAIGFDILPSAGGFGHAAQVTLVDADGTIFSQVYGGTFSPQAIVDPLLDIAYGRDAPMTSLSGLVDKIKLFCTVYNPNTGRYYFNYSLFIGIAIGLASLLAILIWLVHEFRRSAGTAGDNA